MKNSIYSNKAYCIFYNGSLFVTLANKDTEQMDLIYFINW